MRRFLVCCLLVTAALCAGATDAQAADNTLSNDDIARLSRYETVTREKTIDQGDHRYVGGVTYTVMDASTTELAAVFETTESLGHVLPKTKHARFAGVAPGGDQLVEIASGNAVMEAAYTLRVRRMESALPDGTKEVSEIRFWLDRSRPHGIDDAWGFFRYEPFMTSKGEPRVLMTYGILVDVGPGIVRELFEERVRAVILSVPQLVRREAEVAMSRPKLARRPL